MKKCFSPSRLLFCLFFLFGSQATHAQFRFDHWTADKGLPQNSIRDIIQTRDGYLWLATHDGLVRFDGVRFTVFNKSNSPGIITNRFIRLYEDAQGDLWASAEVTGLTRLHEGRFVTYTTENGLPGNRIDALGEDGYGNLMFFCRNHLFRWLDGKFQPADDLRLPVNARRQSRQNPVLQLSYDVDYPSTFPAGRVLWFANGQLCSRAVSDFSINIRGITAAQDQQGNIWFASDEGLFKTNNGRELNTYTMNNGLPGKHPRFVFGQAPLQVVTMGDDGSIWLTGLDSMQSRLLATRLPEGGAFPPYVCWVDREDNFWIGTLYDGLYRARRQSITTYAKPQGLTNTEVYPVFEDRAGTIWVGSDKLFRLKDGAFTNYPQFHWSCSRQHFQQFNLSGSRRPVVGSTGYGASKTGVSFVASVVTSWTQRALSGLCMKTAKAPTGSARSREASCIIKTAQQGGTRLKTDSRAMIRR